MLPDRVRHSADRASRIRRQRTRMDLDVTKVPTECGLIRRARLLIQGAPNRLEDLMDDQRNASRSSLTTRASSATAATGTFTLQHRSRSRRYHVLRHSVRFLVAHIARLADRQLGLYYAG